VTPLQCGTPRCQRFPVNSLFLGMREIPGNRQNAHGMGLSREHVGEYTPVLTIFPVDFPDTGNFLQRRVRCRLGPPPTSLDKRETFSVSRRLSRCSASIARTCSPYPSSSEATSQVLGVVSLSGPVAVPFALCQRGLRVQMTVPLSTSLQRCEALSAQ
jgi:hypothetical protein